MFILIKLNHIWIMNHTIVLDTHTHSYINTNTHLYTYTHITPTHTHLYFFSWVHDYQDACMKKLEDFLNGTSDTLKLYLPQERVQIQEPFTA